MTAEQDQDRPLLELLQEVTQLLDQAGVSSTLIGALAIRLRVSRLAESDAEVQPGRPETLARAVLATGDIDLVVADAQVAADTLLAAGFIKVPRKLVTYRRGGFVVDLIPERPTPGPEDSINIPAKACAAEPLTLPGSPGRVQVARPGALLVLKAVAWRERTQGRDLADIAVIALGHQYLGWEVAEDLKQAVQAMPVAQEALREVVRQFGDPNPAGAYRVLQRGPVAHCRLRPCGMGGTRGDGPRVCKRRSSPGPARLRVAASLHPLSRGRRWPGKAAPTQERTY